jgi:hypothetical protein
LLRLSGTCGATCNNFSFFFLFFFSLSFSKFTHFTHVYSNPQIQRHKLRVILFPPVYATLAWFAYLHYDYSTTIMFFATCFEAFAVYNLYSCLQAYLKPFRKEYDGVKESKDTKIMFVKKLHL